MDYEVLITCLFVVVEARYSCAELFGRAVIWMGGIEHLPLALPTGRGELCLRGKWQ